jgi:hypothetical protein
MATIRTYWGNFSTFNSATGAQANADSTPTGTAYKNGSAETHTTVTVTNVSTGFYKWTAALDGTYWSDKDELTVVVAATVNSITETDEIAYRCVHAKTPDDNAATLGTPTGASIAADLAEIEGETDDIAAIKTQTDKLTFDVVSTVNYLKTTVYGFMGTLLAGTAAYIAGAFNKFFNIQTPTGTVNSLPDAVAGATNGLALKNGDVNVKTWAGTTVANGDGGFPEVDVANWRGAQPDILVMGKVQSDASVSGTLDANIVSINGQSTTTNSAVLKLKQLDITNADSHAMVLSSNSGSGLMSISTGSSGDGITATSAHGNGLQASGSDTGHGILAVGHDTGDGLRTTGSAGHKDISAKEIDTITTSVANIPKFPDGFVHVDSVVGSAGTAYPLGEAATPVSNLANAITIMVANKIKRMTLRGPIVIGSTTDLDGYYVEGFGALDSDASQPSIDMNGSKIIKNCMIKNVSITNTISAGVLQNCDLIGCRLGSPMLMQTCRVIGSRLIGAFSYGDLTSTDQIGFFKDCTYGDDKTAGYATLTRITAVANTNTIAALISGGTGKLDAGSVRLTTTLLIEGFHGDITVPSIAGCTVTILGGSGTITNNSTSGAAVTWNGKTITSGTTFSIPTISSDIPIPLDATGTRTAIGLATANLDTQLAKIDTLESLIVPAVRTISASEDIVIVKSSGGTTLATFTKTAPGGVETWTKS